MNVTRLCQGAKLLLRFVNNVHTAMIIFPSEVPLLPSKSIDPETTSDVVHGVEVSRFDCVCNGWSPEQWRARSASAKRLDQKPCVNRTTLVISVLF